MNGLMNSFRYLLTKKDFAYVVFFSSFVIESYSKKIQPLIFFTTYFLCLLGYVWVHLWN